MPGDAHNPKLAFVLEEAGTGSRTPWRLSTQRTKMGTEVTGFSITDGAIHGGSIRGALQRVSRELDVDLRQRRGTVD